MKKRILAMLMCIAMGCALLTGCGSKGGDSGKKNDTAEIEKDFSLKITDSYTFTDPQDLDFNERYVLTGDESCKLLSDMKNFDYTATAVYQIIYGKDGEAAGEYDFFVTPDEESAAELAAFYSSQGQEITQEGNIIYSYVDGDTLQAKIITFAGQNTISEETVKAYAEMVRDFNGLMDY